MSEPKLNVRNEVAWAVLGIMSRFIPDDYEEMWPSKAGFTLADALITGHPVLDKALALTDLRRAAPASAEPVATEVAKLIERLENPSDSPSGWLPAMREAAAALRRLSLAPSTMTGDGPCECCGRDALVWHAPNELWNFVKGGPEATDDPGGLLCPNCFIVKAEEAGIHPTAWELRPDTPALRALPAGDAYRAGVEAAAKVADKRRAAIFDDYGDYEPDTNVTNLPDWAEGVIEELETLAAAIRALAPASPSKPQDGGGG